MASFLLLSCTPRRRRRSWQLAVRIRCALRVPPLHLLAPPTTPAWLTPSSFSRQRWRDVGAVLLLRHRGRRQRKRMAGEIAGTQ